MKYDFNRPYLEPKSHQNNDALAVEATAYALQTIFLIEGGGVTVFQEQIVKWLNTMRLGDGGFISSVDTVIATQALVLYSYHCRIQDITDLEISVEIPSDNFTENFRLNGNSSLTQPKT